MKPEASFAPLQEDMPTSKSQVHIHGIYDQLNVILKEVITDSPYFSSIITIITSPSSTTASQ